MKNTVKFLSMMFVAGAMMFASCEPEPDGPVTPEPTKYTVQVNCNDATMGTVSITPQQATYVEGDTIRITATPNNGYKFLNWNGSITDNPYTYVVKENITFTANFEALPQPAYSVTFNGTPIDVAGYSNALWFVNGGEQIWIFECASRAEGTSVYLPYFPMYMAGSTTSSFTVLNNTELYYETYYSASGNQYGDWQFKSLNNVNCTELDMTAYKISMTASMTMYSLTEVVNGTVMTADEASTATVAATLQNMVFEEYTGAKYAKKAVIK